MSVASRASLRADRASGRTWLIGHSGDAPGRHRRVHLEGRDQGTGALVRRAVAAGAGWLVAFALFATAAGWGRVSAFALAAGVLTGLVLVVRQVLVSPRHQRASTFRNAPRG